METPDRKRVGAQDNNTMPIRKCSILFQLGNIFLLGHGRSGLSASGQVAYLSSRVGARGYGYSGG
jgi:D-arabinose 5-phosphate isomerase GutQ